MNIIKGINGEQTKRLNRLLVLRLMCTVPNVTRTEITKRIGLVKMTVSNIVNELIANGLIFEEETIETGRQGAGRKQMRLSFSEDAPAVMGIWLSRDFCEGVVVSMKLQELAHHKIAFSEAETAQTITEKLAQLTSRLRGATDKNIIGIGVSAIGPLNTKTGTILNPPNFFDICDYPVVRILEEQMNVPVFLQNDMNASALAEKYFGLAHDVNNFGYIGISNGIGAGIVIDDHLFEGTRGFSGEIGHMIIEGHGDLCHCGNKGCLETLISVPKIIQRFQNTFHQNFISFEEVCDFCEKEPKAAELLAEICESLSIGLINYCNMFDPQMVIVGHEGARLNDEQLSRIADCVNRGILGNRSVKLVDFQKSSFGTLAPLYGASVVVLKQIFDGNLVYDKFF